MELEFLYQAIITAILLIFAANLILNLSHLERPDSSAPMPDNAPLVSMLVPARNESLNIEKCLRSLQRQDYPNFEIVVLDDNSRDNTGELVAALAVSDPRIKLMHGQPLPEGWAGKPFACFQLARKAQGEWLLFIDADVTVEPAMLRATMDTALRENPALLSGFPRQLLTGFWPVTVIPLMYFITLTWTPLWLLARSKTPRAGIAIGQFLLFRKDAYWGIGGHEAVKAKIIEDVWLGMEICNKGGRHLSVDLSRIVSCNMYRKAKDMWEGWSKWMYSVLLLSPVGLGMMIVLAFIFFIAPFLSIWFYAYESQAFTGWHILAIFQAVAVLVMRFMVDYKFSEPMVSGLLNPIAFGYLVVAALNTIVKQAVGKGVRWKDRIYAQKSGIH
jgi:chlorobactene glucosyltransferase